MTDPKPTQRRKMYAWWMYLLLILFGYIEYLFFVWGDYPKTMGIVGLFFFGLCFSLRHSRYHATGFHSLVNLICILAILVVPLLPAVPAAKEAAIRISCANNLKLLALAVHDYHDAHDCFPPAYLADESGQPAHSWRTLLLPYRAGPSIYEEYDFEQSWDSEANQALAAEDWNSLFRCPSVRRSPDDIQNRTDYVAVTGDDTCWPTDGTSITLADIPAGTNNVAMLIEINNSDIPWHEPRDIKLDDLLSGKVSWHTTAIHQDWPNAFYDPCLGRNVVMCDGSVHCFHGELTPEAIRCLFSVNEPVHDANRKLLSMFDDSKPRPIVIRHVAFYVWLVLLLIQFAYVFFPLKRRVTSA